MTQEASLWRAGLLALCACSLIALAISFFLGSPVFPWVTPATGFRVEYVFSPAAADVSEVKSGSVAEHAGLRVGDRIYFSDIAFRERWRLREARRDLPLPIGERLRYVLHRGSKELAVTIVPPSVPVGWGTWVDWISSLASLWGILFASLLAIRRPDLPEARLLSLILIAYFGGGVLTSDFVTWAGLDFSFLTIGVVLENGVACALFAVFAALVARPLSPARRALTLATLGFAILASLGSIAYNVGYYVMAFPVGTFLYNFSDYPGGAAWLASVLCGVAATRAASGAERQRVLWATVSSAPLFLLLGLTSLLDQFMTTSEDLTVNYAINVFMISMPIGLTYSVLARRSVDVGYVVSRATVFAVISASVVGIFIVVEWALGTWASTVSHTTSAVVNVCVALALGLSIRVVHRRIERTVDRIFFRKRHEDETALRRFAHEATFMTDEDRLLKRTVETVSQHVGAERVEVVLPQNGGAYDENDPAVLALRAWHEPVGLHRYETALQGEIAFPMISRGQLLGIIICGPKSSGESYAPDEIDLMTAVGHGVGSSLDTLSNNHNDAQTQMLDMQQQILAELQMLSRDRSHPRL